MLTPRHTRTKLVFILREINEFIVFENHSKKVAFDGIFGEKFEQVYNLGPRTCLLAVENNSIKVARYVHKNETFFTVCKQCECNVSMLSRPASQTFSFPKPYLIHPKINFSSSH